MTVQLNRESAIEDPDRGLVRQATQGSIQAFQQLFERHHRRVYGLVWRLAGNSEMAQDLTQEVFIKLWGNLASFRGESKFSTWLHTVATRVALTELRKNKRWQQVRLTGEAGYADTLEYQESADLSELDQLIRRLPAQTRWAFVLHCIEGLRHEEVAAEMGIAVGTSKAQVHRARMMLEEWLSDDDSE
ncbi:RNA polymerase sigma factor [Pseudidiomarina terrestris]|uniref:Sigma-70 family RNA polymerase sigma factor n=1 Tax=Pseudidiomarina terrestris TaxID=2820060 RepID=A0AAW7QWK2_9GAMM|nr:MULTISPECIES: sigma-70 family RNA polymerase sigma factor [unclassified Pseudidiomarina]MDN7123837.1 sigma-70 family RNA polymerase sigma factor [Pseudidiomarina sp. 1APP75-32.1]MDN7127591.1 sigma-70 family RNA polymerase sigma factor [Pseudidiomarina sp. 1APR75-33.1]MDN7130337.1 sigma-70 family RNA polymerase sigma factor [Pseudidiomarina sp. 1APR75-15]MDN7136260.1 sigma-70 family RNA polymerase sigma factor [Pseudidiomarina sp. 1ASP75-5]MDN7138823.1 sigma-70 family RNA polymerase sigma fa